MTEQKITDALRAAGLDEVAARALAHLHGPDDDGEYRIGKATLNFTIEYEDGGRIVGLSATVPNPAGQVLVPAPLERCVTTVVRAEDAQYLSAEQRERVADWLSANGIDPKRVPDNKTITVEYKVHGDRRFNHIICFHEYYENADGNKEIDLKARDGALTYPRYVRQKVALKPDPNLAARMAQHEAESARDRGSDA